jgi:dihydrofolate synthase / folylpolyglutamate synthase
MNVKSIKTRILQPPKDDLLEIIRDTIKEIPEKSILVVTSKVVSIWEGRCIPIADVPDKDALIRQEADLYLDETHPLSDSLMYTIKNNRFAPFAGIDESNGHDHYVLFPENSMDSARRLHDWLQEKYRVKEIGVVITDSAMIPLHRGTIGVALGYWGLLPIRDYRNKPDLFGRLNKFSWLSIVDGIAGAGVFAMGESDESTPLALVTDPPEIKFTNNDPREHESFLSHDMPLKEDMYYPLIKKSDWKKGGSGYKIEKKK